MNERNYNISSDVNVSVSANSKKEAIKKAEELLKGLDIQSFKLTHDKRTTSQNNAIHKYCDLLAQVFNEAGLDMKVVLRPDVDIEWTTESVKKYIWKPIQLALLGIDSTTKLKKQGDIDRVYDTINRHLSQRFAEWITPIPFPNNPNKGKEEKAEYDYPQLEGEVEF